MHIQRTDNIFFAEALRTLPGEIEFGDLSFYSSLGIPRSELSYIREGALWKRKFSLDPLHGLNQDREIILAPKWATINVRFGSPQYATSDYHEFVANEGLLERLLSDSYLVKNVNLKLPLEQQIIENVMKVAQLSLRGETISNPGLELTIPGEKIETERVQTLVSWYQRLERRYSHKVTEVIPQWFFSIQLK